MKRSWQGIMIIIMNGRRKKKMKWTSFLRWTSNCLVQNSFPFISIVFWLQWLQMKKKQNINYKIRGWGRDFLLLLLYVGPSHGCEVSALYLEIIVDKREKESIRERGQQALPQTCSQMREVLIIPKILKQYYLILIYKSTSYLTTFFRDKDRYQIFLLMIESNICLLFGWN